MLNQISSDIHHLLSTRAENNDIKIIKTQPVGRNVKETADASKQKLGASR